MAEATSRPARAAADEEEDPRAEVAIMWFRRDLRVDDNPALAAAQKFAKHVVPLYIWAPEEEGQFQPGRCSRWWAKRTVVRFAAQLAALGGARLVVRRADDSARALLQAAAECGASAVFFNHLYDPISLVRDHEVKGALRAAGVAAHTTNGDLLYEPWEVLDPATGQPYTRFDDFWAAAQAMPQPPAFPLAAPPQPLPALPAALQAALPGLDPGTEVDWFFSPEQEATAEPLAHRWQPGPEGAAARLEAFVQERLPLFEHDRAKVDRESTSKLSPWIHFGSISVRYVYYRVRHAVADAVVRAEQLERAAAEGEDLAAEAVGCEWAAAAGAGAGGKGACCGTSDDADAAGSPAHSGSPPKGGGVDGDGDVAMGAGGEEVGGGGGGEGGGAAAGGEQRQVARPANSSAGDGEGEHNKQQQQQQKQPPSAAASGLRRGQQHPPHPHPHQHHQHPSAPPAAALAALAAARAARAQADALARSAADFLRQMAYREYARYLSYHFPYLHERSLLAHLRAVPWRVDRSALAAWRAGQTGYPLVDAGMRQLWSTGWMHNRLRVVCASFAVKHLLLPWQWGLKHYWDAFLDADLENDALGWQYVAGCMADAHPFGYMIDLEAEAVRFDPDGEFVRRWLPALARLPTRHVHAPWRAPEEVLEAAGVDLGITYPRRIVLLEEARARVAGAVEVIERCCAAQAEQARAMQQAAAVGGGGDEGGEGEQQQQGRSSAAAAVAAAAAAERLAVAKGAGTGPSSARLMVTGAAATAAGGSCDGPYRLATDPAVLSSSWAARAGGSGSVDAPMMQTRAAAVVEAAAAAVQPTEQQQQQQQQQPLASTGAAGALSEPPGTGAGGEAAGAREEARAAAGKGGGGSGDAAAQGGGSNTRFFAAGGGSGGDQHHQQQQPNQQPPAAEAGQAAAAAAAAAQPLALPAGAPPPQHSTGSAAATVATVGCAAASGSVAGGVAAPAAGQQQQQQQQNEGGEREAKRRR